MEYFNLSGSDFIVQMYVLAIPIFPLNAGGQQWPLWLNSLIKPQDISPIMEIFVPVFICKLQSGIFYVSSGVMGSYSLNDLSAQLSTKHVLLWIMMNLHKVFGFSSRIDLNCFGPKLHLYELKVFCNDDNKVPVSTFAVFKLIRQKT